MIKIIKENTASFDVDAQNGFTFICKNELPVCNPEEIVDEINKNATKAKFRYVSKDAHPQNAEWTATEDKPQFTVVGLPNVDIKWNSHCVVGSLGFELIDELPHISTYDFIVYKGVEKDMHPYSPIYHDLSKKISTGVIEKAKIDGVNTFILGGLALNFEETPLCLGSCALDLKNAGFNVIVNIGATASLGSQEGKNSFIEMLKNKGIEIIYSADEIEILPWV